MVVGTTNVISRHLSGLFSSQYVWMWVKSSPPKCLSLWFLRLFFQLKPPATSSCNLSLPHHPAPFPKLGSLSLPTAHLHCSQSIFIECSSTSLTCLPARHLTPSTLDRFITLPPSCELCQPLWTRAVAEANDSSSTRVALCSRPNWCDIIQGFPRGDIPRKRPCSGSLSADKARADPAPLCCHPAETAAVMQPFLLRGHGCFWHALNQGWALYRGHDADCTQILFLKFTCCFSNLLVFHYFLYYYTHKFVRLMSVMHSSFILGLVSDLKSTKPILHSHEWIDIRNILFWFHHSGGLILFIVCSFYFWFLHASLKWIWAAEVVLLLLKSPSIILSL